MLNAVDQYNIMPSIPKAGSTSVAGSLQGNAANIVPSERQSIYGAVGSENAAKLNKEYVREIPSRILRHPRQAPSAVSSEQFLSAKSLLGPAFQHNVMSTKIAQISNLYSESPRFRDQIDILA